MEKIKSLADQLREEMNKPPGNLPKKRHKGSEKPVPAMLEKVMAYDNSQNKSMVHVRFDERTVMLMNQFKLATGTDVTKLVSFSVKHLFETYPELKTIIKEFIQNTEL